MISAVKVYLNIRKPENELFPCFVSTLAFKAEFARERSNSDREKEESVFWETHNPLDYPNEFKKVNMQIKRRKQEHKHEWENKEIQSKEGYIITKYIQCKTCKKVSIPNKLPLMNVRKGRIRYNTKGAFGKQL